MRNLLPTVIGKQLQRLNPRLRDIISQDFDYDGFKTSILESDTLSQEAKQMALELYHLDQPVGTFLQRFQRKDFEERKFTTEGAIKLPEDNPIYTRWNTIWSKLKEEYADAFAGYPALQEQWIKEGMQLPTDPKLRYPDCDIEIYRVENSHVIGSILLSTHFHPESRQILQLYISSGLLAAPQNAVDAFMAHEAREIGGYVIEGKPEYIISNLTEFRQEEFTSDAYSVRAGYGQGAKQLMVEMGSDAFVRMHQLAYRHGFEFDLSRLPSDRLPAAAQSMLQHLGAAAAAPLNLWSERQTVSSAIKPPGFLDRLVARVSPYPLDYDRWQEMRAVEREMGIEKER